MKDKTMKNLVISISQTKEALSIALEALNNLQDLVSELYKEEKEERLREKKIRETLTESVDDWLVLKLGSMLKDYSGNISKPHVFLKEDNRRQLEEDLDMFLNIIKSSNLTINDNIHNIFVISFKDDSYICKPKRGFIPLKAIKDITLQGNGNVNINVVYKDKKFYYEKLITIPLEHKNKILYTLGLTLKENTSKPEKKSYKKPYDKRGKTEKRNK